MAFGACKSYCLLLLLIQGSAFVPREQRFSKIKWKERSHVKFPPRIQRQKAVSLEMAKKKFYAVAVGKKPGIYETWPECEKQVNSNILCERLLSRFSSSYAIICRILFASSRRKDTLAPDSRVFRQGLQHKTLLMKIQAHVG